MLSLPVRKIFLALLSGLLLIAAFPSMGFHFTAWFSLVPLLVATIKELEARTKLVEANKITLELRDQQLRAEEKKLSVGLATNFDVITAQRDYMTAQSTELQSRINFNMTIARIYQILARTFKAYNINFKELGKNK